LQHEVVPYITLCYFPIHKGRYDFALTAWIILPRKNDDTRETPDTAGYFSRQMSRMQAGSLGLLHGGMRSAIHYRWNQRMFFFGISLTSGVGSSAFVTLYESQLKGFVTGAKGPSLRPKFWAMRSV
jgi:hypothetical protein